MVNFFFLLHPLARRQQTLLEILIWWAYHQNTKMDPGLPHPKYGTALYGPLSRLILTRDNEVVIFALSQVIFYGLRRRERK